MESMSVRHADVVVNPLPKPLFMGGGESNHPSSGPPGILSLHLANTFTIPAGAVNKSRGDNVVCMWVQLKR